ncbi:MAG: MATE family efflux transporter [Desulfovibrionales bacterium]|nr:MATE family efflux transporter [Desulfovibrionales bacterium]
MLTHIPSLLRLALPLILSTSTITLMQIVDAFVLSLHSSTAVAAMGPSSMAVVLFQGFLFGIAAYAGTFVAHNHGRGDTSGIHKSTWLGIQTSLMAGVLGLVMAWPVGCLFLFVGHEPDVALAERTYFWICMAGSLFPVLSGALAGWLAGTGRATTVTWVTMTAFVVNAVLDWGFILGEWGLPRLGIAGAALGTVIAQAVAASMYLLLFGLEGGLGNRLAWAFHWHEFAHFLKLAMPMGFRISVELMAWTFFLLAVGRIGTVELAVSSIAFRINGLAFFPAMGLAQAAGILAAQARGAGRDQDILPIAWQSLAVCEVWLLVMATLFATASAPLVAIFAGQTPETGQIIQAGIIVMKFIAAYCLFDAANIVFGGVLGAVGDTRWVARTFFGVTCFFLVVLGLVDWLYPNLYLEWTLSTLYILATAVLWTLRIQSGAWRKARVLREKMAG